MTHDPSDRGGTPPGVSRRDPSPKLAITVDPEVHRGIIAAAADDGVSVSAWIASAARQALLVRQGLQAVADWEVDHGELTEAEMDTARQRVRQQLGGPTS